MEDAVLSVLQRLSVIAAVGGVLALCGVIKAECRKILKKRKAVKKDY